MKFIGTKEIDLNRILLRPFEMKDVNDVFVYASDEEITKYLTWNPHKNIQETESLLKNVFTKYDEKTFRWAIVYKKNNKVIGSIDVARLNLERESVEIGYVLNRAYHNQGLMSEAFKGVIDYLFNDVDLKEIRACFELGNEASKKVMEKCGLKSESLIIERTLPLKDNKKVFVSYYALKRYQRY